MRNFILLAVLVVTLLLADVVHSQDLEPASEPLQVAVIVSHLDCREPNPDWGNCTPIEGSSVQVSDLNTLKAATTNYLGTATLFFNPVTLPSELTITLDGKQQRQLSVVAVDGHSRTFTFERTLKHGPRSHTHTYKNRADSTDLLRLIHIV